MRLGLSNYAAVQQNLFPPNILPWAGASILGNLKKIEKMSITNEDYNRNGKLIKDHYWEMMNASYIKIADAVGPRVSQYSSSAS